MKFQKHTTLKQSLCLKRLGMDQTADEGRWFWQGHIDGKEKNVISCWSDDDEEYDNQDDGTVLICDGEWKHLARAFTRQEMEDELRQIGFLRIDEDRLKFSRRGVVATNTRTFEEDIHPGTDTFTATYNALVWYLSRFGTSAV